MSKDGLPNHFVITATTRKPRRSEKEGVNHFFVNQVQFKEMIESECEIYALHSTQKVKKQVTAAESLQSKRRSLGHIAGAMDLVIQHR